MCCSTHSLKKKNCPRRNQPASATSVVRLRVDGVSCSDHHVSFDARIVPQTSRATPNTIQALSAVLALISDIHNRPLCYGRCTRPAWTLRTLQDSCREATKARRQVQPSGRPSEEETSYERPEGNQSSF